MAKKRKQHPKPARPMILIALGLVLMVAAAIWFIRDGGPPPTGDPAVQIPFPEVQRVSLADAYAAYQTGGAVFLDVRGDDAFAAAHIPGAISIPLQNLPAGAVDRLDPGDWIITYCT